MPIHKKTQIRLRSRDAFSLVEVMVASVILTVVGFGTLTGLLQSRRMTEGSIYASTATTVAQGYIEQIKSIDFNFLDGSTISKLNSQGLEDSLLVSPVVADMTAGNEDTDLVNTRFLDINNTPDNPGDDLELTFVLYVEDITNEGSGVGQARRMILRWSYIDRSTSANVTVSNTLYAIRSQIPTF